MTCKHERISIGKMRADTRNRIVYVNFTDVHCADCGETLHLASEKLFVQRDGSFALALEARCFDPNNLRCPSCRRRLFGVLSLNGRIVGIRCGEPHLVDYHDGAILSVSSNGTIEPRSA